jgi:phospholipase/carboxylesterase
MTDRSMFDSQSDDAARRSHEFENRFACARRLVDLTHDDDSTDMLGDADMLGDDVDDVAEDSDADGAGAEHVAAFNDVPAHPEILELLETLLLADPTRQPASEARDSQRPHSVYLPEHYEAGYAYPLVVWFHSDGGSESDLSNVMPLISDRNYIGVALRGDIVSGNGFGWSEAGSQSAELLEDLRTIVTSLRREYHIHSERIYLAGFGSGATTAVRVMLKKPEWFGGVTSFGGEFPATPASLLRCDDLKSKRILLATSMGCSTTRIGDVVAAGRMLYSVGMQVGTRVYQDAASTPSSKMLRDLNSWLMDDICDPMKV